MVRRKINYVIIYAYILDNVISDQYFNDIHKHILV